ncbi:D-alanyl-D-alanine carboxypeptidase (penicillin-binding protein 5/6) [Thermoactinomyces sp. DSM 45891]|uniref:D-alanyl-D-alanine carboxypeptidase family protein n=1 Tax=Thermoactinomyces sp. DSM 45891 TaxID=1761907 RepID=UPI00091B71FF|nr:D-alanyl-D-alanine carboxypeptidase family protein [Thermoactinomyces sp. DSM 45891]SFX02922.1 D-alanyl-D-alanine carboxypeptidase (penicillin-binding protein 5/6) [Thermoactinomyces sp. DSM 45891]
MLKRISISVLLSIFVLSLFVPRAIIHAAELDLAPNAKSAVLMDADTGTIIYEKNSHEKLPPASITKVMTMLLVMESIEQKKLKLTDSVTVSENASSKGGSQIFLEPGESMTVHDLLKGVAIGSANDASVALAEHIGGTEDNFVAMMNKRAVQLGLKDTKFQNPNGLPVADHYSSAYDIALLSRELLKHPEITKYTSMYQDYLRQDSKKPFWLVNTNKLVRFYQGLDGLKTGFTTEARFCLTATAKRDNFRVISVVLGEPDSKMRNQEISKMLDYAFSQYTNYTFYKKGDLIAKVEVDKGDPEEMLIRAHHSMSILMKKGEDPKQYTKVVHFKELKAPIKQGETIGTIDFTNKEGKVVTHLEITSSRDIQEASLWNAIQKVFTDIFK